MPAKKKQTTQSGEALLTDTVDTYLESWDKDKTKETGGLSMVQVTYKPSEKFPEGRVYATGPSLQTLKGWIRRFAGWKHYHDIDIVNACPTIAMQVFEKHLGENCFPLLTQYVADREGMIQRLQVKYSEDLADKSFKEMKKLFLVGIHLGDKPMPLIYKKIPELKNWAVQFNLLSSRVCDLPAFKHIKDRIVVCDESKQATSKRQKRGRHSGDNPKGTRTAYLWQSLENKALQAMANYFREHGGGVYKPGVLVYDGIMVTRPVDDHDATTLSVFPLEHLRNCEAYVLKETGLRLNLVEKSLEPTAEDIEKYWGRQDPARFNGGKEEMRYTLWRAAHRDELVRMDGFVLQPHPKIPGAFIKRCDYATFISETLANCNAYHSSGENQSMMLFMEAHDHPKFRLYTPSDFVRPFVSFQDGTFSLDTGKFILWEDFQGDPPTTDHFFDCRFADEVDKPTPLWDKLLGHQLESEEKLLFEVLSGRLFYPVGFKDGWQVAPFIKGVTGTGKSTVFKIIRAMFPPGAISVINTGFEPTFGLSGIYMKRVLFFPDLPKNMQQVLSQTLFQTMVTGDTTNIAKKHGDSIPNHVWVVAMMLFSNYFPNWTDKQGQISRRLATYDFNNQPEHEDTRLDKKIIETELVSLFIRMVRSYLAKVEKHKDAIRASGLSVRRLCSNRNRP
jgi:hypothetical protein